MSNESIIYTYLMANIKNEIGVCALMGNLFAESKLDPNNTQDSCEKRIGYANAAYTKAVDSGKYKKFSSDSTGYGLAQWTSSNRKAGLLKYAKGRKGSVGDLTVQLEYLYLELKNSYKSVLAGLEKATDLTTASTLVLKKFESPKDQGVSVQKLRASYGQKYYNQFHKGTTTAAPVVESTSTVYTKTQFYKDVQKALGIAQTGKASDALLNATVTVSKTKNKSHPVVVPLQKFFNAAGYKCGDADGIAGSKFDLATKQYQTKHNCIVDGEFTAKGKTWKTILGL